MGQYGMRSGALSGQLGANQAAFNMGQQGINNQIAGQSLLSQVGAGQDANTQAALLGQNDLFNRQNGSQYDHLMKTMGLLGQSPDMPHDPTFLDFLGLGTGLLGKVA